MNANELKNMSPEELLGHWKILVKAGERTPQSRGDEESRLKDESSYRTEILSRLNHEAKMNLETKEGFPKYLMEADGQKRFYTLFEAGRLYDSGFIDVRFGRYVLEADGSVRKMNDNDKADISSKAEEYSGSK